MILQALFNTIFKKKSHRFAILSYQLRTIASLFMGVLVLLEYFNEKDTVFELHLSLFLISIFYPQIAFIFNKLSEKPAKHAEKMLDLDAILSGFIIGAIHYGYLPATVIAMIILANYISVLSLKYIFRGLLFLSIGIGLSLIYPNYELHTHSIVIIDILSLLMVMFYVVTNTSMVFKNAVKLKKKTKELEAQNSEIKSSIQYAESIQKALLNANDNVIKIGQDYFIYFKPRDIVSGDFYLSYEINENEFIWIVGDCTGHGVPGAFMSVLGISIINEVVHEKKITQPNLILNRVRQKMIETLGQQNKDSKQSDGMDIAICKLNKKTMNLQFSGAFNPLYLVKKEELIQFKGDKQPIGVSHTQDNSFTLHEVKVEKGDKIYIFSDGYSDQFGGELKRKFMVKKFRDLILSTSNEAMIDQKTILDEKIENWMQIGECDQIDDICIMGIEV